MKQTSGQILIALAIASLALVIFMIGQNWSELKKTELDNQALFECGQSSRYQVTNEDGSVVWYPVAELYQVCLEEKGL